VVSISLAKSIYGRLLLIIVKNTNRVEDIFNITDMAFGNNHFMSHIGVSPNLKL
jgi:hypothetical protein